MECKLHTYIHVSVVIVIHAHVSESAAATLYVWMITDFLYFLSIPCYNEILKDYITISLGSAFGYSTTPLPLKHAQNLELTMQMESTVYV